MREWNLVLGLFNRRRFGKRRAGASHTADPRFSVVVVVAQAIWLKNML